MERLRSVVCLHAAWTERKEAGKAMVTGASRGVAMGGPLRRSVYGGRARDVEFGGKVAPTRYEKKGSVRDVALMIDYRYSFGTRGREAFFNK